MARTSSYRSFLDYFGHPRVDRLGYVEDSLMEHQATRFNDIRGQIDPWLLIASLLLGAIGVVMVGSSSLAIGEIEKVGKAGYLIKQSIFLAVGVLGAIVMTRIELKELEKRAHLALLLSIALLLLVWVPGLGVKVNGARRWINLGISNFQVVEAVKLLFIIWMASFMKRFSEGLQASWKVLATPFAVTLFLVVLLMAQPDFGSSVLLFTICGGMLVLGGGNVPRLMLPAVALAIAAVGLVIFEPYRMRRVTSFLRPWDDPFGQGFLERLSATPEKTRNARLKKIGLALALAVPQFSELRFEKDDMGHPHLQARYQHHRPNAGWQSEEHFSDGTLRLFGLLWMLLEGGNSMLLLEEPEISLNDAIVAQIPLIIERLQRGQKSRRQVLLTTHSEALLSNQGIDERGVVLLESGKQGTTGRIVNEDERLALRAGLSVAEVVLPKTRPSAVSQLGLWQ